MGDFFYGEQANIFSFYRFPKVLFTDSRFRGISVEAKVLYGLLLDRMGLSVKNGVYHFHGGGHHGASGMQQQKGGGPAAGAGREGRPHRTQAAGPGPAQPDLCEDLHGCPDMTIQEVSEVHFRRCRFYTSRSVESTP